MLNYLKDLSIHRAGWLLLLLSALALEGSALYFQYGMDLAPCVMCIYERVALFGIAVAGLIGLIAPRLLILRLIALLIGLGSAVKGLLLALKHVDYQLHPAPWNQCAYKAEFPHTLPLDQWFPAVFSPYGSCSDVVWELWGLSMAQWIAVIFAFYTLLFILLLISQLKTTKKRRLLFK